MAVTTTDYEIAPEDGWVEVAGAPTYALVKPDHKFPYAVAISDGAAPAASLRGAVYDNGEPFSISLAAEGGELYVRVTRKPVDRPLRFAVITNGT